MNQFKSISALLLLAVFLSCDSGPKVIEAESDTAATPTAGTDPHSGAPAFKDVALPQSGGNEEHKVVVEEKLDTDKYSYLLVSENGDKFWIAISKMDVEIGGTYYYRGGLLKKDFYSKEHDRTFETVYLVSELRKQPAAGAPSGGSAVDQALSKIKGNALVDDSPINVQPAEGAIQLSNLFSNTAKYNGKSIKVTGKIVKVNPMIMGRNWLHLRDGSGKDLDLTVTTTENIPLGHVVTLEGVIALNKDFGAGYRYDVIMEGAVLK